MTCDFHLQAPEIRAVKPGSLVCVTYGASQRYFIRHDDDTGDLVAYTTGRDACLVIAPGYGPTTSTPWLPMMLAQRGDLRFIAAGLPRAASPQTCSDNLIAAISSTRPHQTPSSTTFSPTLRVEN